MSNFGQGVAAVAGAVVGFVVGGPTGAAYGFQLGLLAGSALFPTQLPGVVGPRLEDLDQPAADPGSPVPIAYGTIALTGSTIWLGPVVEESETDEVGGKGAPEQEVTTYSYRQGVALGICEGPAAGVTRIWENGKLVYDLRAQLDDETDDAYLARVASSTEYAETFELYLGSETQEPDPTIEADKGAGNVPAFRGLVYIVYANRLLRDDQARRHPAFKFEVSTSPADVPVVVFTESGTWTKPVGLTALRVVAIGGGGGGASGGAFGGNNVVSIGSGGGGGGGGLSEEEFTALEVADAVAVTVGSGGIGGVGPADQFEVLYPPNNGADGTASTFGFYVSADGGGGGGGVTGVEPGAGGAGATENGADGGKGGYTRTTNTAEAGESSTRAGAGGGGGGTYTSVINFSARDGAPGGNTSVVNGGQGGFTCQGEDSCTGDAGSNGESSEVYEGGAGGGGGGAANAGMGATPVGPAIGGAGAHGGVYGGGGGGGGPAQTTRLSVSDLITPALGGFGGDGGDGVVVVYQTFGGVNFTLADVVEDVCHRAGLYDIDVEDLRQIPIDGYAVARPMPARSAIEPLRSFGYFDVVESGSTLRFVARGGPVARTLEAADLGAHLSGDMAGPAITTRKLQDVELPRQVRVRYLDTGRDYEMGEQLSPVRLTTRAENDTDVDLPIAMNGTRAAQIAEVLWADAWRSRWVHATTIEGRFLELEPTDVVDVPIDGRVQRMRIISIEDDDAGALRRLELVRDGSGAYTSYAVAADPDRRPNTISTIRGSALLLLDLPALRDQDDDAGIYAAAYPTGTGSRWDGAVVYRSADDGGTFASVGSIVSAPAVGVLPVALEDGISSTFDEGPVLVVDLEYGDLESRTEAALLEGANTAAIGADGRWQLIQFRDVEQITATRYELRGIIRGRRGTEHETSGSVAGDRFVMVSTGQLARLTLQTSEIGATRLYRAVSIGRTFATGENQSFSGRGVALRPFSPIDVTVEDQGGGDILITWIRRNRLGQELRDGVEIPMSESPELYAVDIYAPGSPTSVLRTLTSSTESATYTVDQQTTDFGSPATTAAEIGVAVYQVSNIVGRGVPGYSPGFIA